MKHCIPKPKMESRYKHSEGVEKSVLHPYKGTSIWTSIASLLLWLNFKITGQFDIEIIKLKQRILPYIAENDMNEEEYGEFLCVGSEAEGTTIDAISDTDLMFCLNGCMCYEINSRDLVDFNDKQYKLIADRRLASHGYTLLWDVNEYVPIIEKVSKPPDMVTNTDESNVIVYYCRNTEKAHFREVIVDHSLSNILRDYPTLQIHGPAFRLTMQLQMNNRAIGEQLRYVFPKYSTSDEEISMTFEIDMVLAIEFISKDITQRWVRRRRRYGWPSNQLVNEVSDMPGHVVFTGNKGSKFERYERRISYTLGECKLVRSLNEVQILMLIYLKYFFGVQLKSLFPCFTSYILKNIILWLSESVQPSYFKCENFLPLLLSTLTVISRCVEKKYLPSYMIPERNLFKGKFDNEIFRQLIIYRMKWVIEFRAFFSFKIKDTDMLDLYKKIRTGDKASVIAQHHEAVRDYIKRLLLGKDMADNKAKRNVGLLALRLAGCIISLKFVGNKYAA